MKKLLIITLFLFISNIYAQMPCIPGNYTFAHLTPKYINSIIEVEFTDIDLKQHHYFVEYLWYKPGNCILIHIQGENGNRGFEIIGDIKVIYHNKDRYYTDKTQKIFKIDNK